MTTRYQWADELMKSHPRTAERRKLANNTYLERRGGSIAVKLHNTDVLTYHPDGSVTYNTGGWYTVTTKERMNSFGQYGIGLYSQRGQWQLNRYNPWTYAGYYFDGVTVAIDGEIVNPLPENAEREEIKARAEMKKRIKAYTDLCIAELEKGMPTPSGADCWHCCMRVKGAGDHDGRFTGFNGAENIVTLGDANEDYGHLLSHMEEGYVVPSLLWNAVESAGYPQPGVILWIDFDEEAGVYRMGGQKWTASYDNVRRAVRKYLGNRLIGIGLVR